MIAVNCLRAGAGCLHSSRIVGSLTRAAQHHGRPSSTIMRFASGYGGNGGGDTGDTTKNPCAPCYGRTLDDLPVPKGCWYAAHERRQRAYNIWMGLGVVYLAVSVVLAARAFNFLAYPERSIVLRPEDFQ